AFEWQLPALHQPLSAQSASVWQDVVQAETSQTYGAQSISADTQPPSPSHTIPIWESSLQPVAPQLRSAPGNAHAEAPLQVPAHAPSASPLPVHSASGSVLSANGVQVPT